MWGGMGEGGVFKVKLMVSPGHACKMGKGVRYSRSGTFSVMGPGRVKMVLTTCRCHPIL